MDGWMNEWMNEWMNKWMCGKKLGNTATAVISIFESIPGSGNHDNQ